MKRGLKIEKISIISDNYITYLYSSLTFFGTSLLVLTSKFANRRCIVAKVFSVHYLTCAIRSLKA